MSRLFSFFALFLIAVGLLFAEPCQAQQAVLRVGDTLELRLSGVPGDEIGGFSAGQTIDDGGMLNLPYIGKIKVAGLDVSQAQQLIESKLKSEKIFTNPTVTLSIQANMRLVNVTGEVKSSGRVSYTADMTLMSAIAGAGGFSDFADKKHVKLTREGKVQDIDTRKIAKDPSLDVRLLPGDQVYIPQSSGFLW